MLSRICCRVCAIALFLTSAVSTASDLEAPEPPAPVAELPPVPNCSTSSDCRLPSSDSVGLCENRESVPECHPLPDLTPALLPDDERLSRFAMGPARSAVRKVRPVVASTITAKAHGEAPQQLSPIQHLQRAADHLEAAGRRDEAAHIRREADAMQHEVSQRLQELRQQQEHIEREIRELEKLTAIPGSERGVLLGFLAPWCSPCRTMEPILSRLERQGFPIRRIDVDKHHDLVSRYEVTSIPTFVLTRQDKEISRNVGVISEQELRRILGASETSRIMMNHRVPGIGSIPGINGLDLKAVEAWFDMPATERDLTPQQVAADQTHD